MVEVRSRIEAGTWVPDATAEAAQRPLLESLHAMEAAAQSDPAADPLAYAEARYLLAAWADEIFTRLDWEGRDAWRQAPLERRLFQTERGGELVFERIDALLELGDPGRRDLARLYLMALELGFSGRYAETAGSPELAAYGRRLAAFAAPAAETPKVSPEAYRHIAAPGRSRRLPDVGAWIAAAAAVLVLLALLSLAVWREATEPLRHELQGLREAAGPIAESVSAAAPSLVVPQPVAGPADWALRNLPVILALLIALVAVIGWLLFRMALRARRRTGTELETEEIDWTSRRPDGALRRSFARAREALAQILPGRGGAYRRPWVLALGPSRSGKSTLLGASGLALPFGGPGRGKGPDHPGLDWWAFPGGVVLDVVGERLTGAQDRTAERLDWLRLMAKVRRARPRRPLDGILVTLPATELVDPAKPEAQRVAEASRRGATLHRKLAEVQEALGMRLPVCLLVTRCDRLSGFGALAAAVPAAERQQMFGWSNDAPPDTAYSPAWVERAFATAVRDLEGFQLARLPAADGAAAEDDAARDRLVLFPGDLRELLEPVRVVANHLFREKAGIEPFFFRGLFFCGATPPAKAAPAEVLFVGDLLDEKVFSEAALARPTERARFRARAKQAAAAAVIAAGAAWAVWGLVPGGREVEARVESIRPLVERIGAVRRGPPADGESARRILEAASGVESLGLRSALLPASWLSPLPARSRRVLRRGLEEGVLAPLRADLERRVDRLADDEPPAERDEPRPGLRAVEDLPQFAELERFVRDLGRLEDEIDRYDRFAHRRWATADPLTVLNELSTGLLGARLEPPNGRVRDRWSAELARLRVPEIYAEAGGGETGERLRARAWERIEALFARLFDRSPIERDLERLSVDLARVPVVLAAAGVEAETYRAIRGRLEALRRALALDEAHWMGGDRLFLGRRFEAIRYRMLRSRFLGPELDEAIRSAARHGFGRLQSRLLSYETGYTGPLLERREETLVLRPPLVDILESLTLILGEPFMKPQEERRWLLEPRPGFALRWKTAPLDEAVALYETYRGWGGSLEDFLAKKEWDSLPVPLRRTEPLVTRETVAENIVRLVARSQERERQPALATPADLEAAVRAGVRDLRTAEPALAQILEALDSLGYATEAELLAQVLRGQQLALLGQLGELLAALEAYRPWMGGFGWWAGEEPPAQPAFRAATADELTEYLTRQRQAVARLSTEYAQPLLGLFGDSASRALTRAAPESARWTGIATDLSQYENQAAGNPVAALETLIATELGEIDLYNCFEKLGPTLAGGAPADFFAAKAADLRRLLFARCQELADELGFERYAALSDSFRRRLAGRFPFSAADAAGGAAPDAIRELFRDGFARTLYLIRNLPSPSPRFGDAREEVQDFMEKLDRVRAFFAMLLGEDPKTEVPIYDLYVRFRVLRASEAQGNQILSWKLFVGDRVIDLLKSGSARAEPPELPREPDGRWVYGTPVRLTLGWASGSPYEPVWAERPGRVSVRGKTLEYSYRDPWALLRLLLENAAEVEDFRTLDDPHPETIKIFALTASKDDPGHTFAAVLFTRIALLDPESKKELPLPAFPRSAPVPAPAAVSTGVAGSAE